MKFHLTTILMFFLVLVQGQKLIVNTEVSSTNPYLNEEFQVTYKLQLNGSGSFSHNGGVQVKKDIPEGLVLVNEGRPQRDFFSFGGGMSLAEYALVLKANKTGQIKLPEFSFLLGGKEYKAKQQTIRVSKGVDYSNRSESRDFFVELSFSSKEVYKGEPVFCSVKLFNKVGINGIEINKAEFESFKVKELEVDNGSRKVNMGGRTYYMQEIAAYQLKPLKSGKIDISPLDITVQTVVGRGFRRSLKNHNIKSLPYKLIVKDLPSPKPNGFINAVGNYKLISKLSSNEIAVNEAVNWEIEIKGSGNIDLLSIPELSFDDDLEVFDPKLEKKINSDRSGTKGRIKTTYVLVPREAGKFDLPEFKLVYFNPKTEQYETLKGEDLSFLATGGEITDGSYVQQKNVASKAQDIRYIKRDDLPKVKADQSSNGWLWFWIISLITALVFIFFNTSLFTKKATNNKVEISDLIKKTEQLEVNSQLGAELIMVIQSLFELKWSLISSKFSKSNREEVYRTHHVDDKLVDELESLLEQLEMSRYAGLGNLSDQQNRIINLLKNL